MAGKLIVITGLDGSGTSSLGESLAKIDPSGVFIHTPEGVHDLIRSEFDSQLRIASPVAHYLYYLSAVVSASDKIKDLLKTHNVYCVRYLIDTVVSHRVMGLDVDLNYDLGYASIVKPDVTFFVGINEDVRQNRISARGKSDLDKVLDDEKKRSLFLAEFNKFKEDLVFIENSGTINELVNKAVSFISTEL